VEAYAVLVRRYRDRIYSHACYLIGDADEAADLTQEALIQAYRALPQFRPDAKFAPWLYRIATNLCASWRRRQKRRPLSMEDLDEATSVTDPFNPGRPATPEEAYETTEFQATVRRALRGLPVSYRQVLVLRYLEDLSYREIAAALGLRVTTVENRLRTGRRLLRERLAGVVGAGLCASPSERRT
jgi:RNA polymerase sigma-70 factor (ECF subfamily)